MKILGPVLAILIFSCHNLLAEDPILPNPLLTPGVALTNVSIEIICEKGYVTKEHIRDVSENEKKEVFIRYFGNVPSNPGSYEIDHLISLELGGANSISNLWPQTYDTRCLWNAHVKDALENKLAKSVRDCLHDNGPTAAWMLLHQYQVEISSNWTNCYLKYVGKGQANKVTK